MKINKEKIFNLRKLGYTYRQIGLEIGVSYQRIYQIINNYSTNASNLKIPTINLPNFCQLCGIKDKLQIHHKDHNSHNNNISNLVTLCVKCHIKVHKKDNYIELPTNKILKIKKKHIIKIGEEKELSELYKKTGKLNWWKIRHYQ